MLARRSIAGVFHGSPSFLIVQSLFKLDSEAPLKETSPTVFAQSFFKRISSQSDSFNANVGSLISETQSKSMVGSTPYVDIPQPLPKRKRKPLITPIKELIRRARKVREMNQDVTERVLQRPENGLLVRRLVPVAHQVYQAKTALYEGVAKLVDVIPVQACRNCSEVHIGSQGHQLKTCEGPMSCSSKKHVWRKGTVDDILVTVESFHLYDRVGRAVTHKERFMVDRLPAIIELCIQAGLDLPDFPTKRRAYPVYMVAGKIVDFEKCSPPKDSNSMDVDEDFESRDFWDSKKQPKRDESPLSTAEDIQRMAQQTLEAWEDMKSGARKLMEKYAVKTCAYCPEVQVGPKGHRARICQAHKHQWRDGQHGWQEATFDDLIPPKYVWHVRDPNGPPLENKLRKYYGMAPAVVELCVQGGATVPDEYKSMMRLDVTIPDFEEIKFVA